VAGSSLQEHCRFPDSRTVRQPFGQLCSKNFPTFAKNLSFHLCKPKTNSPLNSIVTWMNNALHSVSGASFVFHLVNSGALLSASVSCALLSVKQSFGRLA